MIKLSLSRTFILFFILGIGFFPLFSMFLNSNNSIIPLNFTSIVSISDIQDISTNTYSLDLIYCTAIWTPQDGTELRYLGSSSYGDYRNVMYLDDDAYIKVRKTAANGTALFEYSIPNRFYEIYNMTILFNSRRCPWDNPASVSIYNFSSNSWESLSWQIATSTSFSNYSKILTNISTNLLCYQSVNNKVLLNLTNGFSSYDCWYIDYTHINISGVIDDTPPESIGIDMTPDVPYSTDVIQFNVTAEDEQSGLANNSDFYFNGDIGIGDNISFRVIVPLSPQENYTLHLGLLAGDWNLISTVFDNEENAKNVSINFVVLPGPSIDELPNIFITANTSTALRNETIKILLWIQNGTQNLDTIWLYNGFIDSNVTIESDINNQSTLLYKYYTNSSNIGSFLFTGFVNDSNGNVSSFDILENVTIIADKTIPTIVIEHINDTYLGIGKTSQINFSVLTDNSETLLDSVWYYDPLSSSNISVDTDIGDTSRHYYLINSTSYNVGTYYFTIYANDSLNNEGKILTWITWAIFDIDPNIKVEVDSFVKLAIFPSRFSITVSGTEHNLSTLWFVDPITDNASLIADNIDSKVESEYDFVYNRTFLGTLTFDFFVNDSYNNTRGTSVSVFSIIGIPAEEEDITWLWITVTGLGALAGGGLVLLANYIRQKTISRTEFKF